MSPAASRIRNVIFDVGNVLIRWDPRFLYTQLIPDDAAREAFLTDVCSPAWNLEQDRGRSWAEAVAERSALFPAQAALIRAFDTRWQEMVPGPVEGGFELVERLRARDVPLFAITNFSHEKWAESLVRFPVLGRFRDTIVSAEHGLLKPDPAIYRLLLARNGLAAEECLFIDDSAANVAGARAIGMAAHHFTAAPALEVELTALGLLV